MTFQDGKVEPGGVRLNDEDVAYLLNVLRNATQPVSTQQLIDVLRRQPGQFHIESEAALGTSGDSPR